MKYNCPFCKSKMQYHLEKQYFYYSANYSPGSPTVNYFIHKCKKSECKIGLIPKYKIWEYQGKVRGMSIILDSCLITYKIVSRYDLNEAVLSKVERTVFPSGTIGYSLNKIIETNEAIKIDLNDPISSGLQSINRLMKLRAFS